MHKDPPSLRLYEKKRLMEREPPPAEQLESPSDSSRVPAFLSSHLCWGGLSAVQLPLSPPCSFISNSNKLIGSHVGLQWYHYNNKICNFFLQVVVHITLSF